MKKGLKGWVEIFRAGKHTDSQGRTQEFTADDLDKTVSSYDPAHHEAPVVVGHPRDNGPAWAWVEGVRRVGEVLQAKFKQIAPEFEEMVTAGRFKKRSVSLYPDGSLRHIGFLGAQPPAIKGLKDFSFGQDEECHSYEFEEVDMGEVEKLQKQLQEANARADKAEGQVKEFKEKADRAEADFAESESARKKKEIENFVEQGIKDSKMLPAWKDMGIVSFMTALDGQEETYEFSEGKKESPLDWFKGFISSFGEHPLFKDMSNPEKEGGEEGSDFAEEEAIAKEIAASTGVEIDD